MPSLVELAASGFGLPASILRLIAQERRQVARHRVAEPHHDRVLRPSTSARRCRSGLEAVEQTDVRVVGSEARLPVGHVPNAQRSSWNRRLGAADASANCQRRVRGVQCQRPRRERAAREVRGAHERLGEAVESSVILNAGSSRRSASRRALSRHRQVRHEPSGPRIELPSSRRQRYV